MRVLAVLVALVAGAPATAQTLAVIHAEAWTMDADAPVHDATILLDGARIVSVTAKGQVPARIPVIDARGKPVTPGLVNAASQLGLVEVSSAADTRDSASTDAHGGPFDLSRALNGNSTLVELARADGITRAVIVPGKSKNGPLSGEASMARLREGADITDRSNIAVFGVVGGGEWDGLGSRGVQWQALRKIIMEAKAAATGEPGPKDHGRGRGPHGGPRPLPEPLKAMAMGELPLALQTNREADILQAIALAHDTGVRLIIVGGTDAWRVADRLAAAKIGVILDPQANLPSTFDQLGARQDNAAILAKAGVAIAFGFVGGPIHATYNAGVALRSGAGLAVANGLPYFKGLQAVTTGPLALWGGSGGTLSAGADADLVVWDGDPLEPSTSAVAVIVEGRQTSVRTRQDRLAERYAGKP